MCYDKPVSKSATAAATPKGGDAHEHRKHDRAFDACDIGLSFALGIIIKVVQGSPVVIGGVVIGLK